MSRTIPLGSLRFEETTRLWLLPSRSDTDIVPLSLSVQYNCNEFHSTVSPSQTPMLLWITVILVPSVFARLMFRSVTSLQNIKPVSKWTSMATALDKPEMSVCVLRLWKSKALMSLANDTKRQGELHGTTKAKRIEKNKTEAILTKKPTVFWQDFLRIHNHDYSRAKKNLRGL